MKKYLISELLSNNSFDEKEEFEVLGWIKNKRQHKNVLFLVVCDSSGEIQIVAEKKFFNPDDFELISGLKNESSVSILGFLRKNKNEQVELSACSFSLIGEVTLELSPSPRSDFDIFDERHGCGLFFRYIMGQKENKIAYSSSLFFSLC